jgi:hypothetical protein
MEKNKIIIEIRKYRFFHKVDYFQATCLGMGWFGKHENEFLIPNYDDLGNFNFNSKRNLIRQLKKYLKNQNITNFHIKFINC